MKARDYHEGYLDAMEYAIKQHQEYSKEVTEILKKVSLLSYLEAALVWLFGFAMGLGVMLVILVSSVEAATITGTATATVVERPSEPALAACPSRRTSKGNQHMTLNALTKGDV